MTTRQRILLGIALLLIVTLAVLGREFVRTYIAPTVLYTLWSIWYTASGIPQFTLWGVFLGILLVIGLRSLLARERRPRPRSGPPVSQAPGRVRELASQLATMGDSAYFKQRVIRHLATLTLDTLGHRDRLTTGEARALIDSGRVDMDDELIAFLEKGWQRTERHNELMTRNRTWLDELRSRLLPGRPARNWHDPQIDKMIAFLEAELEVQQRDD